MKYRRILLKLSGEALLGDKEYGIDKNRVLNYLEDIKSIKEEGIEIAIVIGGGNFYRGANSNEDGISKVQADYMGMLATIINGIYLQEVLEKNGINTKLLSGLEIEKVCEKMSSRKAIKCLEKGYVVIISGGTGNPYFTTDTAAALRATEIKADVLLKGTRVDGVYSSDPEKNKDAVKFKKLTFDEAYNKKLKIMDLTAFTLCQENNIPIIVFDMNTKGNLKKIIEGKNIGTIIVK